LEAELVEIHAKLVEQVVLAAVAAVDSVLETLVAAVDLELLVKALMEAAVAQAV
jgi:hypothetical protein